MKTKINRRLRGFIRIGSRSFLLSTFYFLLLACATIGYTSCTTTKTESNGTVTTTTGIDHSAGTQAAISAATQIATAAATAAISTYLTAAPNRARLMRSSDDPINAAKKVTESEIHKSVPTLSPLKVHNIVSSAYAREMRKQTESP